MRKVLDDWMGEISIGRRKINNLRYVDDTLIIAEEKELKKLDGYSIEYGFEINETKTEIVIIDRSYCQCQKCS